MLARPVPCSKVSYIGHLSPSAVIQLATALSEDVHDQNPAIIVKALAGSYLLEVIQGSFSAHLVKVEASKARLYKNFIR